MNCTPEQKLLSLYENQQVFHGEMHDHSASGGTSDGKCTLDVWIEEMARLDMDFAAILDHRQVRHMYLPNWQDGLFIPGTEPGTFITDSAATRQDMHYLMLFPDRDLVAKLLEQFPEFEFTGGTEGHFTYPTFTRARFGELIDAVMDMGGFFVHPHPKQYMQSDDPCQYHFRDGMGIEVFYWAMESEYTRENYSLWLDLLKAGKRIFACAGGDQHERPHDLCLTTLYAGEKTSASFIEKLRKGDFTCGPVSIRMLMGDTVAGGVCAFENQTLTVCTGDFHQSVKDPTHKYRLVVLDDQGVIHQQEISCEEDTFVTLPVRKDAKFVRAEVFDLVRYMRIAVGNPIWNK